MFVLIILQHNYNLFLFFKRFEENFQLDTPGPGAYEIVAPQICYGSIFHAPFGAFDHRFRKIVDVTISGIHMSCEKMFYIVCT